MFRHVVKNLNHEEPDRSPRHRDREERDFFKTSRWRALPPSECGVESLRKKLSESLLRCIKRDLPVLLQEIEDKLAATKSLLAQLGPARTTPKDQRVYLINIAVKLRELISVALEGDELAGDFTDFFRADDGRKLRNRITKETDHFVRWMRVMGHHYQVVEILSEDE